MRLRVPTSVLFALFVLVSVVSGIGLAELEGAKDRHPVLGPMVTVFLVLTLPTLIAASVSAWRDASNSSNESRASSLTRSLVSPMSLFAFGAFSLILSLTFAELARASPLSPGGALVAVLEASAIPSLVTSFVWTAIVLSRPRPPSA